MENLGLKTDQEVLIPVPEIPFQANVPLAATIPVSTQWFDLKGRVARIGVTGYPEEGHTVSWEIELLFENGTQRVIYSETDALCIRNRFWCAARAFRINMTSTSDQTIYLVVGIQR